jgi:hypothetical protein
MKRQTVKVERFVDESEEDDMNFSLEESNYLRLIKYSAN